MAARRNRRTGELTKTDAFWRLLDTLDRYHPLSAALDNRARLIRANQIDSNIATEAIAIFDAVAEEFNMDITLLGHPSLSGIASGRGDFGSVGWANAGRLRAYLKHADDDWRPGMPDDGKRLLQMMKFSHGPLDKPIALEWKDGRFYTEPIKGDADIGRQDKGDRVFLKLLARAESEKVDVTNNPASTTLYAPKLFFNNKSGREGLSKPELARAMSSLLEKGAGRGGRYPQTGAAHDRPPDR